MADDKKPSEVLGGWNQQVAKQLGQIADNTGGEGTAQASAEKRPSDVLGGWYKEVSDLLDDIATNTEGGGAEPYVLPTMSQSVKGGATVGEGLTMDGTALSVDYSDVASVDALEEATALSPTGGIVSTQDGLAISPTQQSTGAIDGALLELTAKSKPATQQTTTGKNLANPNESSRIYSNLVSRSYPSQGTVVLTSATTGSNPQSLYKVNNSVSGTYTLSFDTETYDAKVIRARIGYIDAEGNRTMVTQEESTTVTAEIDLPDGASVYYGLYWSNSTQAGQSVTFSNIQLELGSTATPYEPYTGGAPSPSPDWPQPIVTVTGHEVTGKEGRYVSLERRDHQGTLLDTTQIPLPSRGWVAGLPDGTADELSVDGAGKVVWEEKTNEVVIDGDSNIASGASSYDGEVASDRYAPMTSISDFPVSGRYHKKLSSHFISTSEQIWVAPDNHIGKFVINASNAFAQIHMVFAHSTVGIVSSDDSETRTAKIKSWLSANPVTVLYPLKNPVTEDCGYIEGWTNDFSEGYVLSIPELDDLGIKYHIDGAVSTLVHQWYEKSRSEYEDRLASLEDAVAQLIAEG